VDGAGTERNVKDLPQQFHYSFSAAKINSERIGDVLAIRRFVKNQKLLLVQGLQEPDFLNLELLPSQRTVANQYEGEDELKQPVLGNGEIEEDLAIRFFRLK
jgi:hypothetical protein